ncbi:MAG TPA: hypothetical protein VFE02_02115 [Candidatus Acidoferrales bacterium]|jgi:hypothetical protein|nr:hypothetical protein [Candidatus Acidoferrales bacterium]
MRIGRQAIYYGIRCSALFFFTVAPCFGQIAKQFVNVEPNQCWLDVKDAVHRRAYGVITDERFHTLTIDRFASVEGTIAIVVEVQADQNKKGEQGCSITVGETGNSAPYGSGQRINAANGSGNFQAAAYIASQVKAAQKKRDRNAKK